MVDLHPLVPPQWLTGLNEEHNELNSNVANPRGRAPTHWLVHHRRNRGLPMAHRTLDGMVKEAQTGTQADWANRAAPHVPPMSDPMSGPGAAGRSQEPSALAAGRHDAADGDIATRVTLFASSAFCGGSMGNVRSNLVSRTAACLLPVSPAQFSSSDAGQSLDDGRSMSSIRRLSSSRLLAMGFVLRKCPLAKISAWHKARKDAEVRPLYQASRGKAVARLSGFDGYFARDRS
jgi:hypothetical protein